MPFAIKVFFTIFVVVVGIGIVLVNPRGNNAGPDVLWRWGRKDFVRTALFRTDGSFRRFTKVGILAFFALFVAAIWLAIPTEA